MAKKIKSFTVDEDAYIRLITMFKKHGAETSISLYLNNQVKWLLEHLEDLEKGIQEYNYEVPMSFVIDEIVRSSDRSGKISDEIYKDENPVSDLESNLMEWRESYEAYQQGIPEDLYHWFKSGRYSLSKDKKYLVEKDTGKKFITEGKNRLMEVREVNSKNKG